MALPAGPIAPLTAHVVKPGLLLGPKPAAYGNNETPVYDFVFDTVTD
jgi:hypothetical protein